MAGKKTDNQKAKQGKIPRADTGVKTVFRTIGLSGVTTGGAEGVANVIIEARNEI